MTTIVTRSGKGSPLTHTEVDTNFTNLNTAKLETAAIPLGTLQAPSVSFLNDSDTGIFCPQGGNSLAIATGGQYAITCTSTQAVGIKTANPQKALHVAGPTRVGADDATDAFLEIGEGATGNRNSYIDIVADTTYTDYGLRIIRNNTGANATSELKHRGTGALNFTTQEAAPIVFNTTNSPALTILAGGNVGIGTSTPTNTSKLEIQTNSTTAPGLWVQTGGTTSAYPIVDVRNGANLDVFAIKGDGTSYFQGKLGIGTTAPSKLLTIGSSTTANTIVRLNNSLTAGSDTGMYSFGLDDADDFAGMKLDYSDRVAKGLQIFTSSAYGFPISFSTNGSQNMTIDTSGRLLVGTSTARGNFFRQGTTGITPFTQIESAINSYNNGLSVINNSASGFGAMLNLATSYSTSLNSNVIGSANQQAGTINFLSNDGTNFVDCAQIRADVDGTPGANDMPGRLVFSTTADGASSPTERLHIKSNTEVQWLNVTEIFPFTDNSCLLGKGGNRWSAVWAANGTIQTSDQRAKSDITDAQLGSEFIKNLRPVSYKWIEGGRRHTGEYDGNGNCVYESVAGTRTHWGFIAQEVKQAVDNAGVDFGGWVLTDNDDPDSQQALRYDQFIAPLTKALQEALAEIDVLKAKVAALEGA